MMNLSEYLDLGICAGLGSDVSGGHTLDPFSNMVVAIQTGAALYLSGQMKRSVSASEVFYCATKGGSFFGKEHIEYTFNAFCKIVIHHAEIDESLMKFKFDR